MTSDLQQMSLQALVARYEDAASAHGRGTEAGDKKATNAAYKVLDIAYREIRRRGPDAQAAILGLVTNEDPWVRLWAGAHALEFAPGVGEPTLQALELSPNTLASFDARMTLLEWREGR